MQLHIGDIVRIQTIHGTTTQGRIVGTEHVHDRRRDPGLHYFIATPHALLDLPAYRFQAVVPVKEKTQ